MTDYSKLTNSYIENIIFLYFIEIIYISTVQGESTNEQQCKERSAVFFLNSYSLNIIILYKIINIKQILFNKIQNNYFNKVILTNNTKFNVIF